MLFVDKDLEYDPDEAYLYPVFAPPMSLFRLKEALGKVRAKEKTNGTANEWNEVLTFYCQSASKYYDRLPDRTIKITPSSTIRAKDFLQVSRTS